MSPAHGSPEFRIEEPDLVVEALAADLEASVRRATSGRRAFTIAIPGGSVATHCFPRLAALTLDVSRLEFFWTDERAVPPASPDSNFALAKRLWLDPAGVPAERIHRMPGEASDLDRAAREYADELMKVAGDPPRLDYVLLGVGPDGHVASLFPGHAALARAQRVLAIDDAPKPPARRLSLSLPVLADAARVVMVAFGTTKARVMGEIAGDSGSMLPAALVARRARRCLILLDREAGSGVEPGNRPNGGEIGR